MSEFVSVSEAARMAGVSRATVSRRIRAGELSVYARGLDRRQRLLRRADVERLSRIEQQTTSRRGAGR